jgi:hypothetical protein
MSVDVLVDERDERSKRECNLLSSSVWIEGVLRLGIEKRVSDDEKRKKRVSDEGEKKKRV